jgi:hypothetical protein
MNDDNASQGDHNAALLPPKGAASTRETAVRDAVRVANELIELNYYSEAAGPRLWLAVFDALLRERPASMTAS